MEGEQTIKGGVGEKQEDDGERGKERDTKGGERVKLHSW